MNNETLATLYLLCLITSGTLLAKNSPCQREKWMYSTDKERCVRCKCPRGYEKTISQEIPYDKVLGALQCPNCTRCDSGYYSNRQTNFQCVECSTPCRVLNRLYKKQCDGRTNVKCGDCITGYFEWLEGTVSCTSCKDNWRTPECGESPTISTGVPLTKTTPSPREIRYDNNKETSTPLFDLKSDQPQSHESSSGITLVILCVVSVALAILILLVLYCVYKVCCKFRRNRNGASFGSTSTQSTGSSGLLLKEGMANTDLEMDSRPCEGDIPRNNEIISDYDEDVLNKLKSIAVKRDGSLLRTIATKIDKDPSCVFKELKIGDHVLFQAKKNNECEKHPIAEYYLTVLKKWVEKNDKEATKAILYKAFWNAKMYSVCLLISCDDKS